MYICIIATNRIKTSEATPSTSTGFGHSQPEVEPIVPADRSTLAVNSKPQTPDPRPHTPNPKPQTPQTTPHTPHPTPHTPHPEP